MMMMMIMHGGDHDGTGGYFTTIALFWVETFERTRTQQNETYVQWRYRVSGSLCGGPQRPTPLSDATAYVITRESNYKTSMHTHVLFELNTHAHTHSFNL